MAFISPTPKLQFFAANGTPLVGGKLYSYAAGTTTPLATYTDAGGGTTNPNPIILDSRGEASVWLGSSAYKLRLTTAADVDIWTIDNIESQATLAQLAASGGSALIGFLQAGTGAQARTVQSKMRDVVSVLDFGAVGNGSADDTAEIQAALTYAGTIKSAVYVPGTANFYKISDTLTVPDDVAIYGDGYGSAIKQTVREKNVLSLGNRCEVSNIRLQGDGITTGGVDFEKNNGVYINTKQNCRVLFCWIHGFEYNGVFAKNTSGLTIQGNVIYENAYSNNTGSDIILYSDIGSIRTNITGNFLVSNNSQGCFVNALGKDTDIAVTNNFACPVDANGVIVTSGNLLRRHGFVLGYLGGNDAGGRISCSNNISLQTRQTGVYWQSATVSGGSVTISHNYIRSAGVNAVQPTLVGGIYLAAQGPSDVVIGNIIENMPQTGFITAAGINMQPANVGVGAGNSTLISGNAIIASAGHGVYVGSKSQNVRVVDNTINGYGEAAYVYVGAVGFTGGLNIEFNGNRAYAPTAAKPGMYISRGTATPTIVVIGNTFFGYDNTTATTDNAGILNRDWGRPYRFENNTLVNFYAGVGSDVYLNAHSGGCRFVNNTHQDCNAAYHLSSLAGAGKLVTEGDQLINTATYQATSLLAGSRVCYQGEFTFGENVMIYFNATPTTGTWAVGDRVQQSVPVVGQPKAWMCTVAGASGTWVSEGNL